MSIYLHCHSARSIVGAMDEDQLVFDIASYCTIANLIKYIIILQYGFKQSCFSFCIVLVWYGFGFGLFPLCLAELHLYVFCFCFQCNSNVHIADIQTSNNSGILYIPRFGTLLKDQINFSLFSVSFFLLMCLARHLPPTFIRMTFPKLRFPP